MKHRQSGAALLTVLMLLAIMAALAAEMTLSFQAQLQRTRMSGHALQQKYDITLAEQIALASLTQDMKDNNKQTTSGQYWAQPQRLRMKETGNTLTWQLHDVQNCFNVNVLADAPADTLATPSYPVQVFTALLLNAGTDRFTSEELAHTIADYIDNDDSPRFHGAEDDYYQTRTPPRQTAGQRLFLKSELRHVKGMTDKIYWQLAPFVCALPSTRLAININSLTEKEAPLLKALFLNDLTDSGALELIRKQPKQGWQTTDAFLYRAQHDHTAVRPLMSQVKRYLFTNSQFFRLDVRSSNGEQSQGWQSQIYYSQKHRSAQIFQRSLTLHHPK